MEKEKDLQEELQDFDDNEVLEEDDEVENDEVVEDGEEEETEDSDETETPKKDDSSQVEKNEESRLKAKKQNQINAERRKQEKAKKEEALRKEGYNKALKESVDGINPYTNKPIKDEADMDIYLEMRELEKLGKDPVTDYADYIAEKNRQTRKEELAKKQQEDYATNDINSFSQKYPDIDVKKLFEDEHFSIFAEGKLGVRPLTDVYEQFLKYESYYEKKAEEDSNEKALKKFARANSNMGAMKDNSEKARKSYKNMSDEEFVKELERVKRQTY